MNFPNIDLLFSEIEKRGFSLNNVKRRQLSGYIDLLEKFNRTTNVISRADIDFVCPRHIYDSLAPLFFNLIKPESRILDLGSGGGLPSIPLSIFLPDCKFDLLDSRGKKARFLERVSLSLNLDNIRVFNQRLEDFSFSGYDFLSARAFLSIGRVLPYARVFLSSKGKIAFFKGPNVEIEISSLKDFIKKTGFLRPKIIPYRNYDSDIEFNLVIFQKI